MKKYMKIIMAVMLGVFLMASTASAFTQYKGNFTTKYPTLGTNLAAKVNNCTICHATANTSGNPTLYGTALRLAGSNVAIATRIAGLEATDTDNDGFTNIQEINADTDFNDPASKPVSQPVASGFTLTSTSFADGAAMPALLACAADGGNNTSPQIAMANLPVGTASVAIIMEDVSTNVPTVHWGMFQLPSAVSPIAEGAAVTQTQIEAFDGGGAFGITTAGQNYTGGAGYAGVCPSGAQHTYKITALALDSFETNIAQYFGVAHSVNPSFTSVYTQLLAGPTAAEFKASTSVVVLGEATLTGGFPGKVAAGAGGGTGTGTGTGTTGGGGDGGGGGCLTPWVSGSGFPMLVLLLLGGIVVVRKRTKLN